MMRYFTNIFIALLLASWANLTFAAQQSDDVWVGSLRNNLFADQMILDGEGVIELEAPSRAEDGAVVPVRIKAGFPQSKDRYIESLFLIIDRNPAPLAGEFHFTPKSGRADLALRIRVNEYSPVRVVAKTNDGKLYMTSRYVKATGGCSAPAGTDLDAAMKRLGKMRFKIRDDSGSDGSIQTRLAISHPNLTGMQKDQQSLLFIPAHFVKKIAVSFEGEPVFSAEVGISVSENPNFQFFFVPDKGGELTAEIEDSKQVKYTKTVKYSPQVAKH
ncbi:MAG: quinoprotein dehydrogenase-associated SoxYZ-like carrier [Gammaproteobacteria bacterium]